MNSIMDASFTNGLPNPQRTFAFLTVAIALTMSVLDGAIVNVALPSISLDLGAQPSDAIWIVTAYQLAITVSLLPLASLGDSLGYKRTYWCGLAVFTAASFACANATTLNVLVIARMVQGLGAAGVMSVNIALVRYIFPREKLGAGVGSVALVVAVSSAAGPSVASAILMLGTWQWLFLVNVPLGIIALFIAARTLPVTPASGAPFNIISVLLNAVTFGALIAGIDAFSNKGEHGYAVALLAISFSVGILFVWRERRLATPILPLDLLRRPVFALSLMTSICSFAAQNMAYIALPFYFSRSLGYSETFVGLLMTPWPVMTALIAPIAGRLSDNKIPPQRLSCAGLIILAIGLASVAMMGSATTPFDIGWRLAICGFGFGLFQSPNNHIIISSAPRERSGGASGLQSMGRLLGQSMGAATVAIVFGLVADEGQAAFVAWLGAGLALIGSLSGGLRRVGSK